MKISFDPPAIVGDLCQCGERAPKELYKAFSKLAPKIALLPFEVEARHLKNTVACMRLMDIEGLAVSGSHQKTMVKHLEKLDPIAARCKLVDSIERNGGTFIGRNIFGLAARELIENKLAKHAHKTVCFTGNDLLIKSIRSALELAGFHIVKNASDDCDVIVIGQGVQTGKPRKHSGRGLILDLRKNRRGNKSGHIIDRAELMSTFCQRAVDILTHR